VRIGIGVFAPQPSGLAVATVDATLALRSVGAEVVLFAEHGTELPQRATDLGDAVVRLEPLPRHLRRGPAPTALFLPVKLAQSAALGRALLARPVDVVHVFSPGLAARLPPSLPTVVQAWFHPPRLLPRLRTLLPFVRSVPLYPAALMVQAQSHASDLLGYRRARLALANTPTAAQGLRDRGFCSTCVPPPIAIPPALPPREPSKALRIAFCSHPLSLRRKGLRYLLEALPLTSARPLEVTLVGGSSPDFDPVIEAARRAGVEVRLLGRVRREEYLAHLAQRTDVLAFPSLYEEWGYALFEALSRGVPALAFDLYPFFDILDGDCGRLVPPRDVRALAAAIDAAAAGDLPAPATVIESARARFGAASVALRQLDAYQAVLG
jgi:glycosyltransferase involved in cell wall biosynthesis